MTENSHWASESPSLAPTQWTSAWSDQHGAAHVAVEWTTCLGAEGEYRLHRVRTGTSVGAGAVVVLTRRQEDTTSVLLVRQDRPGPGVRLWELPRGSADVGDADLLDTGRRELAEETNINVQEGSILGLIYPDSGVLASKVGVMSAELLDDQLPSPADGEVDEVAWFPVSELRRLVAGGELRDGISLSALLMASVWAGNEIHL